MIAPIAAKDTMPDDWVPVECRWLGLDKRTIPPAIIALLVIVLLVGVLPAINAALSYGREIEAGDVILLGKGITFVPAVGWGLADGLLTTDDTVTDQASSNLTAEVEQGGVTFYVQTGPFSGSADQLMNDVEDLNDALKHFDNSTFTSERTTVTTTTGLTGVSERFTGVNVEGMVATFSIDGTGVQIVVVGPLGSVDANQDAITAMIDSLTEGDA